MINCLRKLKRSIKYRKYKEKKVIIPSSSYISDDVVFDGFNRVGEKVSLFHSHIGTGTYICNNVEFHDVEIGRYCSIGSNICLLNGTHPTRDFVSTHPSFYSNANQAGFSFAEVNIFEEHLYLRKEDRIAIEIGNDVWIGNNVIIMGGIRIGNGAIIAAGSVVTKDVPPYSIVGGVPAKIIRSRFSQEDIEYLNRVQWWEKDYEWLYKNAKYFDSVENLKKVLP